MECRFLINNCLLVVLHRKLFHVLKFRANTRSIRAARELHDQSMEAQSCVNKRSKKRNLFATICSRKGLFLFILIRPTTLRETVAAVKVLIWY